MTQYSERLFNEPWWRELRWYVLHRRAGGLCERCNSHPATCVHHLKYPTARREVPSDLLGVCDRCHHYLHFGYIEADNDNEPEFEELKTGTGTRVIKF